MTELAITDREDQPASGPVEAWLPLPLAPWRLPELAQSLAIDRLVWAGAWGATLLAHAVLLYALACEPHDPMAGGGGHQLDAISVTLVSSSVLEAREAERAQASAAATAATVEATDGAPESAPAAAAQQREEKEEKKEQDKEQKRETPVDEPVRAIEAITQVPVQAQRRRQQASAAAAASGGAAARSDRPSDAGASASAAAASAGAVREFARYVTQALAKTKPRGAGGLGTVRIKFTIAADGALTSAEIATSSGSKRLDDTALDAVRRAAFPSPPRGMSIAQLTYEVPYHFR